LNEGFGGVSNGEVGEVFFLDSDANNANDANHINSASDVNDASVLEFVWARSGMRRNAVDSFQKNVC